MMKYCPKCEAVRDCKVEPRAETYPVRGEEIEIEANVLVCPICGEDVFDKELDASNLQKVYDVYRAKHDLLAPWEIRKIRERYGLSQRGMSRLLGWGEITLHRYEAGGVPDRVHNDLLKMISTNEGMARYIQERSSSVPREEAETVRQSLETVETPISLIGTFEKLQSFYGVSIKTGFRVIDIERLRNMILFFAEGGVWKTKLMKLLWYADFVGFRRNTCSISGLAYQRQTYGPVPEHFFTMLDAFEKEKDILMVEYEDNGSILIYPDGKKAALSIFSASEIDILQYMRDYFSSFTSGAISEKSHKERAWLETQQGNIISYDFAKDLSMQ